MPSKYLHARCMARSPNWKQGYYESTLKLTWGEEGLSPNEVEVSMGICSPNDMFCRALGRAVADSKQPVIMPKHKVFKYLEEMQKTYCKQYRGHLATPRTRDLAIALLTCH